MCQWCLWNAAWGRGVAAFPSHWPRSLLPVSDGEGCSSHESWSCHWAGPEPRLSLTPVSGCYIIYSRDAESRDRMEAMVTHHLCGCPNKWGRSFPVLKPQEFWKKVWKLTWGNLYRLNHCWTQPENLCRSHISPPALLKWIGRVWSELQGIFSIFGGYIQRSKYFGMGAKHKKEPIQFSAAQTLLMLQINTYCYKIFTFLVLHSQIAAEQTNDGFWFTA